MNLFEKMFGRRSNTNEDHNKELERTMDDHLEESVQRTSPLALGQAVELGDINYINLDKNKKHGDFISAINAAAASNKPIFANFVEWSG
jgi:hypothetical protein